jgi:hypothetical protein
MDELAIALDEAGGVRAARESGARLRALLEPELARSAAELSKPRSGYGGAPVTVAMAPGDRTLRALVPVDPGLRADPQVVGERAWLLVAATVGALVEVSGSADVRAGARGAAELLPLAFEGHAAGIDRLRARALVFPAQVLADATDFRAPIGAAHPLAVAARVAALGGRPADQDSLAEYEEAALAVLEADAPAPARPHDDPDPARRVARRILQRLDGMGKWGGYHTDFAHLARGFQGNDRALADDVGEALLAAGLLAEKPSVGQRHVFLNPRRARDIRAFIEQGEVPPDLRLPAS